MNVTEKPKPNLLFPASMLLYIVASMQVGVGLFGFQRYIFKEAGHDAWISVILAGLASHLAMWATIRTLRHYESTDIFGIHRDVFGKWLGGLLNIGFIVYAGFSTVIVSRTYIEAVQAWVFPDFPTWLLTLLLLVLAGYGLYGGIRVIVGICLFSFVCQIAVTPLLYYPLKYAQWNYLLPLLEATPGELLQATKSMSFTITGFEFIFAYFPFVQNKERAQRYSHISLAITTLYYLLITITTTVYFSGPQLLKQIWATLSLLKIIQLPFLERLEYIALPVWMFVVLPGTILTTWSVTRGFKRMWGIQQKKSLYAVCLIVFIVSLLFKNRYQIDRMNDFMSICSFYVAFVYPFVLLAVVSIVHGVRKRRESV